MCFIFAKITPKLHYFNDDQVKSWYTSKLRHFKPKLRACLADRNRCCNVIVIPMV